jgi:hypothetical protein
MEGEQDDIQFYFGRAFRALKRAESDMSRKVVDTVCRHPRLVTDRQDDYVLTTLPFYFGDS